MTSLLDRAGQAARSLVSALPLAVPIRALRRPVRQGTWVAAMLGRRVLKRLPGGNFVDGALQLVQTFRSGASRQEKLAGYGSAVGGMRDIGRCCRGGRPGSVVPG
jgi:hypothetical protein